MNAEAHKKKRAVVFTTAHLCVWFFVLTLLAKKQAEMREAFTAAGIALLVAAWIQYRAVLAYRRAVKSTQSAIRNLDE